MQAFERLEVQWAEFNGLDPKGMVACSSGTAALHLALEAFRLPPGSEVLVPDYTMIACPRAVIMSGLTPVFVGCDRRLLMDINFVHHGLDASVAEMPNNSGYDIVEEYGKIEAIMLVHVYGRRCKSWREGSQSAKWGGSQFGGIFQIEDMAEAHGVRPHEDTDAACWSFYKNKIVAGEEGGAVWFRDPDHAKLARQLRTLGFTDAHDYTHVPRGHNYRMSNAHAEPIIESLKLFGFNEHGRRTIELWYDAECPVEWRQPSRDAVWVYDLRIPGMTVETQRRVVEALLAAGVAARYGFKSCRRQQEYLTLDNRIGLGEWESDRASREVIYLPVAPGVTTRDDARRAFDTIKSVVRI